MRTLLWFLLACLVVDVSWYTLRHYEAQGALAIQSRAIDPANDVGMSGTGEDNHWFEGQPLTHAKGPAAFESVGTVHAHVTDCPEPDSDSFSCVKASWERRFIEALGTHTEYCEAILTEEHKELCYSALAKDVAAVRASAPLMWGTRHNPHHLPEDEFKEAVRILGDMKTKMQTCPKPQPGLSDDCLEAAWQLQFKKWIPANRPGYCDIIVNAVFHRLCRTGVALPS